MILKIWFNRIKKFIQRDLKFNKNLPLLIRIKYYLAGFKPNNIINYQLSEKNHKTYLSDWARVKLAKINEPYNILFKNKMLFHNYLKNDINVVQPIAFIFNQKIYGFESQTIISIEEFIESINEDLIIKPNTGEKGTGILKVSAKLNTNTQNLEHLKRIINSGENFIIQKIISQTGFCAEVNPYSVNTLRVLTMQNPETKNHFIAGAVQRFGSKKSDYVDNWHAGGISVGIDIENGIYKKGAIESGGESLQWLSHHPDTGIKFEGIKIENWAEIKEKAVALSNQFFFCKYIGWDIIPMENGFYFLEGNHNSDVDLLQIHGGILENPSAKAFYKYHNIIN